MGIPCCPKDASLPMKYEGIAKRNNGLVRYKFICPEVEWIKHKDGKRRRKCFCKNPCTDSLSGRMFYIYPEKILGLTLVPSVVLMNGSKPTK